MFFFHGKLTPSAFFRCNPLIKETRRNIGAHEFDEKYKSLYGFLSSLRFGQYFYLKDLCGKNPQNEYLVRMMCEIYYHMDFFVNMEFDYATGKVTILPVNGYNTQYSPPDVFSKIIKNPERWDVDPETLL